MSFIICKYCLVDLTDEESFSVSGKEPNMRYFCKECTTMMLLVSDCVKSTINERVFFALASISELMTRPERLSEKTSDKEDAIV